MLGDGHRSGSVPVDCRIPVQHPSAIGGQWDVGRLHLRHTALLAIIGYIEGTGNRGGGIRGVSGLEGHLHVEDRPTGQTRNDHRHRVINRLPVLLHGEREGSLVIVLGHIGNLDHIAHIELPALGDREVRCKGPDIGPIGNPYLDGPGILVDGTLAKHTLVDGDDREGGDGQVGKALCHGDRVGTAGAILSRDGVGHRSIEHVGRDTALLRHTLNGCTGTLGKGEGCHQGPMDVHLIGNRYADSACYLVDDTIHSLKGEGNQLLPARRQVGIDDHVARVCLGVEG